MYQCLSGNMVTALEDKDRRQPWSKKGKTGGATPMETRASARAILGNDIEEDSRPNPLPSVRRRGRKPKTVDAGKGKQKLKSLPAATVNAVLGRGKNPVPDVEEMRKKTEEDAAACGRVMRKINLRATRKTCPTPTTIPTIQLNPEATRQAIAIESPRNPEHVSDSLKSSGTTLICTFYICSWTFDIYYQGMICTFYIYYQGMILIAGVQ